MIRGLIPGEAAVPSPGRSRSVFQGSLRAVLRRGPARGEGVAGTPGLLLATGHAGGVQGRTRTRWTRTCSSSW